MEKEKKDALMRAKELFKMPMCQMPKLAFAYMREMSRVYGGCGDVGFKALAIYAQLEEGLSCNDPLYLPKEEDKQLFRLVRCSVKSVH